MKRSRNLVALMVLAVALVALVWRHSRPEARDDAAVPSDDALPAIPTVTEAGTSTNAARPSEPIVAPVPSASASESVPVASDASDAEEPTRATIRNAIEAVRTFRARMAEYESRLRDAGIPEDRARVLMSGIVMEERARRRMELEGNDETWTARVAHFEAARREIERDSRLDDAERVAAVDALRSRTFPGEDATRLEAWEFLEPPSPPDASSDPSATSP